LNGLAVALVATLASPLPPAPTAVAARIERAVRHALASEALRQAVVSVDVRTLEGGRPVLVRNPDLSMTPASVMKLATTAAALDALGPEARFSTTLQSTARPDSQGHLMADLYLVGGGDPSLSRELLNRPEYGVLEILADALHEAGVRRVEGKVRGCGGLFVGERRGSDWPWEDLVWSYGAEVSALTFADGSANLKLSAGAAPGDPIGIERHPPSDYYRVDSTAVTCAEGAPSNLVLERPFGRNVISLHGCLAAGSPALDRFVALEDPPLYAATVQGEALRAKGIEVTGGIASCEEPPAGALVLARYQGAPLKEILKDVNKMSHNLRAEMLFRLVGQKIHGVGSAEAGRDAVSDFLKAHGVDLQGWDIEDGSGDSRSDLVTARGITDLLRAMYRHRDADAFRDSLPVSGVDGTLKDRLGDGRAKGRVEAKTGTLRHVHALAGYAHPQRGESLVFTVLVNHATAPAGEVRRAIDEIVSALL